jgi:hypothetical protein
MGIIVGIESQGGIISYSSSRSLVHDGAGDGLIKIMVIHGPGRGIIRTGTGGTDFFPGYGLGYFGGAAGKQQAGNGCEKEEDSRNPRGSSHLHIHIIPL